MATALSNPASPGAHAQSRRQRTRCSKRYRPRPVVVARAQTKRRTRERDAMCNCKGSHSSYKTARAFHQNHQGKDEQQMINSAPNMFDAQPQICASHSQPRLRCSDLNPRLGRMGDGCPCSAIEHLDAHQHVGDSQLKTSKLDLLASQPIRSGVDPSPFEKRIRQFLHDRFFQVLHIARHG